MKGHPAHPALQRLVDAHQALERAEKALQDAQEARREAALALTQIADLDERWQAALFAYREFGKGLSVALAEAVTGLPGRSGQPAFLQRAGRLKDRTTHPTAPREVREPQTEWRAPDDLERAVIGAHIAHGHGYTVIEGLGWENVIVDLSPSETQLFLTDPTAGVASALGISREMLSLWLQTEGSVFCEAITSKGTQCKNHVVTAPGRFNLDEWRTLHLRGGYCSIHGG